MSEEKDAQDEVEFKATPAPLIEAMNFNTAQVSDRSRYVSFGVIAIFFTLVSSTSTFANEVQTSHSWSMFWMVVFAIGSLLSDYFQYLCGHINAVRSANQNLPEDRPFDDEDLFYFATNMLFVVKQIASVLSVSFLIWIVATVTFCS